MAFWRRLFPHPAPPSPRLADVMVQVEELESRLDWLTKEFKSFRGRVTGAMRNNAPRDTEADDPGEAEVQIPRMAAPRSDHLSRRFRGF